MLQVHRVLFVLAAVIALPSWAGQEIMEKDALIYGGGKYSDAQMITMAPELVSAIRKNGFSCEMVSVLRVDSLINGFGVACDGYLNNYMIKGPMGSMTVQREF